MSLATLILWLLGGALVLSLVRDGREGPARWLRAKFLGQVA